VRSFFAPNDPETACQIALDMMAVEELAPAISLLDNKKKIAAEAVQLSDENSSRSAHLTTTTIASFAKTICHH
jgi:hypothetical protein